MLKSDEIKGLKVAIRILKAKRRYIYKNNEMWKTHNTGMEHDIILLEKYLKKIEKAHDR